MRKTKLLAILAAVGGPALAGFAQDHPPNAPDAVAGEALVVTVKEVKGTAARQVPDKNQPWVPLRAGDRIEEGTLIRTGFRSGVTLLFADNSVVKIGSGTMMGVGGFRKDGKVTRTRIRLQRGTIRANVHKARGPNDFRVATPVAALAVVGTSGQIRFSSDLGLQHCGYTGVWRVLVGTRKRLVVAGEFTDGNLTRSIILIQNGRVVRVIPLFGLSQAEQDALLHHGSGRGILHVFGNDRIIRNPHPCGPPRPLNGEMKDQGAKMGDAYR